MSFLRTVKYRFSKATLNKVCCTYIRPLLEYASKICDGCNQADSRKLEQVHLNVASIVTGLPIFHHLVRYALKLDGEHLPKDENLKN